MKTIKYSLMGILILLLLVNPALAVDTSQTYNSGILVGLFLAFCALVVAIQLVPTIILLIGFVKGLSTGAEREGDHSGSRV